MIATTRKALAVVDSTGMVWMNPSDVDPLNKEVTVLYTQEALEEAMMLWQRKQDADRFLRRAASAPTDYHEAGLDAETPPSDEITFSNAVQQFDEQK